MKTIKDETQLTVKVNKSELIDGKWLPFMVLSKKIADIEKQNNLGYKSLRTRMYNSKVSSKYNKMTFAGIDCIDVVNPMAKNTASLCISFEVIQ